MCDVGNQPFHYQLSEIRISFCSLLIECATQHGQDAVVGLAREFEGIFTRNDYRNWPVVPFEDTCRRGCRSRFGLGPFLIVPQINREKEDADPGSRVSWRNDLAEVWSLSGYRDRARDFNR